MPRNGSSALPAPRRARPLAAVPLLLALLAPAPGAGQEAARQAAAPGGAQAAPTFAEVTGHAFGERITTHAEMVRYLERLAEASPRVTLLEQGDSWEGRRLLAAVVTAPENHGRIEEIRRASARLFDPREGAPAGGGAEGAIPSDQPVIAWIGGSIHGNELSGSEGVLKVLERLATAEDESTLRVLRNVVAIVDPMLNPDGRDAFALANRRARGAVQSPDPEDWNNDFTSWEGVGFRTGHYFFDTNRDWFAHTQRETRARVPTILAWHPQFSIDAHEMGRDVEFYFDPAAAPYGPFFPDYALEWFAEFGDAYAAAFDSAGYEYMTRERYNYFYPGYTTSYSSYQGSVGMLYEQGTSAGLAVERPDGSVRTLEEALEHQYLAAWTALTTAAGRRAEVLSEWRAGREAALSTGREGARRWLIPPDGGDPGLAADLVDLLRRNGIEVGRLESPLDAGGLRDRTGRSVEGRRLPAGTYVVEAAQPRARLARVLLAPEVPVPEDFLAEARARVERDEDPRFYDITSWSLPLLFDLEAYGAAGGAAPAARPVTEPARAGEPPAGRAGYAYLIDGRDAAAVAALRDLLAAGHRAGVLVRPSRIGGEDVPSGTVVAKVGQNEAALHEDVRAAAERRAVRVRAVDTGHADEGFPSLGSADVFPVRLPSVALVGEGPVHAYSFGWNWYALGERYGIPTTVLRAGGLAGADLAEHDVLVVPDLFSAAGLAAELGEEGRERLTDWVRAGGTLVTIGEGTEFARSELGLLDLRSWYEEAASEDGGPPGAEADESEEDADEAPGAAWEPGGEPYRFEVPGAIYRAELDTLSWLAAGAADARLPVLVVSDRVLLPPDAPPDDDRRAVARYAVGEDGGAVRLSGHAWPESDERLAGAVFLYRQEVGQGQVIAFAEDPSFRGYFRGADRLLLNAVLLGPSAR